MLYIKIFLTLICIMLFIICVCYIDNINNKKISIPNKVYPVQINPAGLNFTKDIEFLHYYIDFIFEDYVVNNLLILDNNKTPYTKNKNNFNDYDEVLSNIITDIIIGINDNYKFILYSYMTEEAIKDYITKIVIKKFTTRQLKNLQKKINDNG